MKNRLMKTVILSTILVVLIQSQPSSFVFPLNESNTWEYDIFDNSFLKTTHVWMNVNNDTIMPNGKTYRQFSYDKHIVMFLRVDSSRVFQYNERDSSEYARYDFSKIVGDTISENTLEYVGGPRSFVVLSDVGELTIFGVNRRVLSFHSDNGLVWDNIVDSIGIWSFTPGNIEVFYTLTGAKIGNKSYGIITTIREKKEEIPSSISLLPNYPNPFNPTTTISYELANTSRVLMTIYNLLGQKQEILINEIKAQGRHSIVWNASQLSSGIYICKLTVNSSTINRKLVLIK